MTSPQDKIVLYPASIGVPEILMLGRYNYRHAHDGLFPHSHKDSLEICYLEKGKQLYRVGKKDFVLTGGDLFITFPNEEHSTGEFPQEKGKLYWIIVQLPRRPKSFLNCSPRESWNLVQQLLKIPHRHFAGSTEVKNTLEQLIHACQKENDPLKHLNIRNQLLNLLLQLIACSRQEPRSSVSPAFSHLLTYIEANIHQTLPIAALAARVQLSLPRFKARFKQEIGIPPAEYILRRKIEAAKKLLSQPKASVTDVAMKLNFSSSQYFATVFRRYVGQSPRSLLLL